MNQTESHTPSAQADHLAYKRADPHLDEVFEDDGQIKPQWVYLLESLQRLGSKALSNRLQKAQRILRDDGATYNIYNGENEPSRTWNLDLIPSLISSEDWAAIEAGLLERSELFNLLLQDIYGERHLIRHGVIPPEALFLHRGFLRACHGIRLAGEQQLIFHAVDMVRDASGRFCVLTDRTQAPSGAGYALESRTVMSRVLPSLFRDSHVHRLAGFFLQMRAKLNSLSPQEEQPRVVLLTPGAHNETYFEHAYLANYLGFHLVQSGDLLVRNGFVWMKSLDGLSRVDVILRRVDDTYCDPVELHGQSQLGIPGLLEVVRSGRVVVANPLGSGVLENPLLLKYLPDIAKALLGRELRLPSVQTLWCADKTDWQQVQSNANNMVIKPLYRNYQQRSVFLGHLSEDERNLFLKQVAANPQQYVAQPVLEASHIPTFEQGQFLPRPALLRSFTVASESSYSVMPGGLTRVGTEKGGILISSQSGSKSKDTWVVASEPERVLSSGDTSVESYTKEADLISLPSRVVENLFWLGRYAERAEASLRFLRMVFLFLNREQPISTACRRIILEAVTDLTATRPGFINASDALIADPESELLQIVKDHSRLGSIRSNLNAMINCADESKEQLSSDTIRVINDLGDALVELDETLAEGLAVAPEAALAPLMSSLMALSGLAKESMVRDFGWRFMEIGRRLERGLLTCSAMNNFLVKAVPESDQATLIEALLLSLESLISYRRRYRARMGVQPCLDLILLDVANPRSLLYQVQQLAAQLNALPRANEGKNQLSAKERAILECENTIKLSLLTELSQREDGERVELKQRLHRVKQLLCSLSTFISDAYFDHRESSQQLVQSSLLQRAWEPEA